VIAGGPDLAFAVAGSHVTRGAAVPSIALDLSIDEPTGAPIRAILLQTQIRIAAPLRRYSPEERERLAELFGGPKTWSESLRTFLWTSVSTVVPQFERSTQAELLVPVTYDFDVAATKYLAALDEGTIPVELLFSGTCFYEDGDRLLVSRISWEKEARYGLPAATWRAAVETVFPNSAWLRLDRGIFDELWRFRTERRLATWDLAVRALLDEVADPLPTARSA
jgi:hypothetical protein